MRPSIPALLAHVAAIIAGAPGCSFGSSSCDGFTPAPPKTVASTGDVACQIATSGGVSWTTVQRVVGACFVPTYQAAVQPGPSEACAAACGAGVYGVCTLPADYLQAYVAAQMPAVSSACTAAGDGAEASVEAGPDSGGDDVDGSAEASLDAGQAASAVCPPTSGTIAVTCSEEPCTGRWTSGIEPLGTARSVSTGAYFARCSYFERASVFAFERLAAELSAHGAPERLVRQARRASRDEVRHARTTRALARRFGVEPTWQQARDLPVRPLVEVACENASEGCVRETYGAALGLVGARRASDVHVRSTLQQIARDECRHAQLSWRVAAWAKSRLGPRDRETVRRAMRLAVQSLLSGGDDGPESERRAIAGTPSGAEARRIARLLDESLFRGASA